MPQTQRTDSILSTRIPKRMTMPFQAHRWRCCQAAFRVCISNGNSNRNPESREQGSQKLRNVEEPQTPEHCLSPRPSSLELKPAAPMLNAEA